MELSHTEENYMKSIYHLSNHGTVSVSTNAISEQLQTTPASVSDMIKKLNQKELISYVKYKGVTIDKLGVKEALKIIRKHRLWETFLVEKLRFQWDQVHEIAEQLEHIKSPVLIKRLDDFLGNPTQDPHGDPIPTEGGVMIGSDKKVLIELKLAQKAIVVGVKDNSNSFLQFLNKVGIQLGTSLEVKEVFDFDTSKEVVLDGSKSLLLSKEALQNIFVKVVEL
ncbi:MAG: metal-dependent transcriptional regulator [Cyclobacteriaceae bacterium]